MLKRKKEENSVVIPNREQIEAEMARLDYSGRYHSALRSTIYSLIVVAAVAVLLATLFIPFLRIYGTSMTPTLENGEVVACWKTTKFDSGESSRFTLIIRYW